MGVHTNTRTIWSEAWKVGHPMGALAASEIGLVATLLGEGQVILGTAPESETVEKLVARCWLWLDARTSVDFLPAFCVALKDYRRKLIRMTSLDDGPPRAIVTPPEWARLAAWISEQQNRETPKPLGLDLGVTLFSADGERDSIRLSSLFADVFGIAESSLPSDCFRYNPDDHGDDSEDGPAAVDTNGLPRLGRFIHALASIQSVYDDAERLIKKFKDHIDIDDRIDVHVADVAANLPNKNLVVGLAILFQAVRWEYQKYAAWRDGLEEPGWQPTDFCLQPGQGGQSLAGVLSGLANLFMGHSGPVHRSDILEGRHWPDPNQLFSANAESTWVKKYFDLLVDAGFLETWVDENGDLYRLRRGRRFNPDNLSAPAALPKGFQWNHPDVKGFLRDSLGFGWRARTRQG